MPGPRLPFYTRPRTPAIGRNYPRRLPLFVEQPPLGTRLRGGTLVWCTRESGRREGPGGGRALLTFVEVGFAFVCFSGRGVGGFFLLPFSLRLRPTRDPFSAHPHGRPTARLRRRCLPGSRYVVGRIRLHSAERPTRCASTESAFPHWRQMPISLTHLHEDRRLAPCRRLLGYSAGLNVPSSSVEGTFGASQRGRPVSAVMSITAPPCASRSSIRTLAGKSRRTRSATDCPVTPCHRGHAVSVLCTTFDPSGQRRERSDL